MNREKYIEELKRANRDFGISNDYLDNRKSEKDLNDMEKADLNYASKLGD